MTGTKKSNFGKNGTVPPFKAKAMCRAIYPHGCHNENINSPRVCGVYYKQLCQLPHPL